MTNSVFSVIAVLFYDIVIFLFCAIAIINTFRNRRWWNFVIAATIWTLVGAPILLILGVLKNTLYLIGDASIAIGCIILALLFIFQSRRRQRDVGKLTMCAIGIILWVIFVALNIFLGAGTVFYPLYHTALTIAFLGLALFLNDLMSAHPRHIFLAILWSSIAVGEFYSWFSWLSTWSNPIPLFNFVFEYTFGFVIAVYGSYVYWHMWRKTREYQSALMLFACVLLCFGLAIWGLSNYIELPISTLASAIFSMEGVSTFTIPVVVMLVTFVGDPDYIFRLPDNYYLLLVTYKNSGLAVHYVRFQSSKAIDVEENLLSGFLTAVNSLFVETLKVKKQIERIAGPDASLLMCTGQWVTVTIAGDKTPAILNRALSQYTTAFEKKFAEPLKRQTSDMGEFKDAINLIPQVFPFLKVRPEGSK